MEEARSAFRQYRRNLTELAWQEHLEANRATGTTVREAKRQCSEGELKNG
jgi:hypothetical protein